MRIEYFGEKMDLVARTFGAQLPDREAVMEFYYKPCKHLSESRFAEVVTRVTQIWEIVKTFPPPSIFTRAICETHRDETPRYDFSRSTTEENECEFFRQMARKFSIPPANAPVDPLRAEERTVRMAVQEKRRLMRSVRGYCNTIAIRGGDPMDMLQSRFGVRAATVDDLFSDSRVTRKILAEMEAFLIGAAAAIPSLPDQGARGTQGSLSSKIDLKAVSGGLGGL
jgi:hypothetical protein